MESFTPALMIVDVQEDFCPPNGSLAVPGGRDIAPLINHLLDLPFALRIASKDWHPVNSKTFASQHKDKNAFTDTATFQNPDNPSDTQDITVWPDHCVQDTPGANLIHEINSDKIDVIVEKGMNPDVEMFSSFGDVFGRRGPGIASTDLAGLLNKNHITHLYVVGLAGDFCVKATAIDATKEGLKTLAIWDAVRSIDSESDERARLELQQAGVQIVLSDSEEVKRIAS